VKGGRPGQVSKSYISSTTVHTDIASELFLGVESGGTSASGRSLVRNCDVFVDGRLQNLGILDRWWELRQRKQRRGQKRGDNSVLHNFDNESMVEWNWSTVSLVIGSHLQRHGRGEECL
jgi:hypothetical protein